MTLTRAFSLIPLRSLLLILGQKTPRLEFFAVFGFTDV